MNPHSQIRLSDEGSKGEYPETGGDVGGIAESSEKFDMLTNMNEQSNRTFEARFYPTLHHPPQD